MASLLTIGSGLDESFADYLHHLHERGAGRAEAVNAFYGLNLLVPGSKRAMPVSRQCLVGFVKSRPSIAYPPLSWGVTCVIAVAMAKRGCFRQAVAVLVAFHCLTALGRAAAAAA